jgi:hypothetical protein
MIVRVIITRRIKRTKIAAVLVIPPKPAVAPAYAMVQHSFLEEERALEKFLESLKSRGIE